MSYEENMNAILNLPIVKELMKKNKKLQKKNKALRNLMYSLPEFRCNCHINCCGQNKVRPLFEQTVEFVDKVFIKKEPGADEIRELNALVDDEVVILDKNPNDKPNIVYEIEETEEVVEEEEEVVEEEEEVVEEEEEVVEEEEEVVEEDAGEVYEINISGKSYYVTNEKNGKIYAIDNNEDVGDEIGEYINGNVNFYKK